MFYQWQGEDLVLNIPVQPRSAGDGFAEIQGDQIKLRITAPPANGKANKHLVAYLAKTIRVAKTNISIVAGVNARSKRIITQRPQRLPEVIAPRP